MRPKKVPVAEDGGQKDNSDALAQVLHGLQSITQHDFTCGTSQKQLAHSEIEYVLRRQDYVSSEPTLTGLGGAAGRVRCLIRAMMSAPGLVGRKYWWILRCCLPKRRTPLASSASSPDCHPSDVGTYPACTSVPPVSNMIAYLCARHHPQRVLMATEVLLSKHWMPPASRCILSKHGLPFTPGKGPISSLSSHCAH